MTTEQKLDLELAAMLEAIRQDTLERETAVYYDVDEYELVS